MTTIAIEACNPLEHADEILELFARNGQPGFASAFARAYEPRAEQGLRSWIARADGRVVMHISVNPMRFQGPSGCVTGGILGDLMVDEAHRDFWAPVRLVRAMVSTLKRESEIRFLFTTATKEAETVFKAGGFKPFGQMRRYVMPTLAPYVVLSRLRAWAPPRVRTFSPADHPEVAAHYAALRSGPYWRPVVDASYVATRMPRSGYADGTWISLSDQSGRQIGLALNSRHAELAEGTLADAFWSEGSRGIAEPALAAASHARSRGFRTLSLTALDGVGMQHELRKAGFFRRPVIGDLLVNPLHEKPAPVDEWFLTGFVLSGW